MKKNGFTLAEVLITLAIIGVIATMTLPALMTNTAEQQAVAGFKKGINTLSNAIEMNQAAAGYDYASITSADTEDRDLQSMYAILANRTQLDIGKSDTGVQLSGRGKVPAAVSTEYSAYFRDGSCLMFVPTATTADAKAHGGNVAEIQNDGLPFGFAAVYDTNGTKGPNILSNCNGTALGATFPAGDDNGITVGAEDNEIEFGEGEGKLCARAKRVIKDQFIVQFRGTTVQPRGAAARWAYEH